MLPNALKSCPKSNLVTLLLTKNPIFKSTILEKYIKNKNNMNKKHASKATGPTNRTHNLEFRRRSFYQLCQNFNRALPWPHLGTTRTTVRAIFCHKFKFGAFSCQFFFQMLFVVQTSRGGRKTRWAQFDEPILVQIDNLQTKLFFLPQRP